VLRVAEGWKEQVGVCGWVYLWVRVSAGECLKLCIFVGFKRQGRKKK